MNTLITLIIGIIGGFLYYYNMKDSIPEPHKNCSFVANIYTDILAFIVGAILIYYGMFLYNDHLLIILGIGAITEHILQITYKPL